MYKAQITVPKTCEIGNSNITHAQFNIKLFISFARKRKNVGAIVYANYMFT